MNKLLLKAGLNYVINRLREPSTYAGVAGAFAAAHIAMPGWAPAVVQVAGVAVASIAAIVSGEPAKA